MNFENLLKHFQKVQNEHDIWRGGSRASADAVDHDDVKVEEGGDSKLDEKTL